jgi:hypothetical protein
MTRHVQINTLKKQMVRLSNHVNWVSQCITHTTGDGKKEVECKSCLKNILSSINQSRHILKKVGHEFSIRRQSGGPVNYKTHIMILTIDFITNSNIPGAQASFSQCAMFW